MQKTEALAALREGKTLTADWPERYEGVLAAHLLPEGDIVRLRRYLGESKFAPERVFTWQDIEAWDAEDWQEWGL